jgi:catechol 2,3-dioxygenase-like lactoylglutathione lyase family enzyme
MAPHLRIARPVADLERTSAMYCRGLALSVVGRFEDHAGFDGVMLGVEGADYHFEFTRCRDHPVAPAPTAEDLIVLYLPEPAEWLAACERMLAAGFTPVASFNPYWDDLGRSFADPDGYRVVVQRAAWRNVVEED